jgi:3-deoxy-D-manno-octulosonic-acid transferase
MYQIYKLLSLLVYPFVGLLLLWRVYKGKEDSSRYLEKLGFYGKARPEGKLVCFHAASIGEFNAILPIIKSMPEMNILVTTVTLTAAKIAKSNLPNNAIHQFAPLDCINIVKRFIVHWKPDLVIWTESELWPNLIYSLSSSKGDSVGDAVPVILVNARLSARSFSRWSLVKPLAQFILECFSLILAQSKETQTYLEQLGARHVEYVGNLKFMASNFLFNEKEVNYMKEQVKGRAVLMAASTHPGEEAIFAGVHQNLRLVYPNLLTIIAPRHPNRIKKVLNILKELNVITRSSEDKVTNDTDILLVDTIGEFGIFFRLSEIVCTGGSWTKIGHSFIEPAKLGNLIIYGPNMDNSRELADEFISAGAALYAKDGEELEQVISKYLRDSKDFAQVKNEAVKMVEEMSQVKERVLGRIKPYL